MNIFEKSTGLFFAGLVGGVMILQSVSFFVVTSTQSWSCNAAGPLSFPGGGVWYAIGGIALALYIVWGTDKERSIYKNLWGGLGWLSLCIGGASNALERFASACVVDYFSFFGLFYFNLADILLTVGGSLFVGVLVLKQLQIKNHAS